MEPAAEPRFLRPLKLTVEYDGSEFYGYQAQAGQRSVMQGHFKRAPSQRSVQDELEAAVARLTGQRQRELPFRWA